MKKEKDKEKNKKGKNTEPRSYGLTRKQKIIVGIATVVLAISVLILTILIMKNQLFDRNEHFLLREVRIDSLRNVEGSYWNDHSKAEENTKKLTEELGINVMQDNIFALNLAEKREALLKAHPEIKDAQLTPILPDTLLIRISERLPVARLDKTKLVDGEGYVVPANYFPFAKSLPLIQDATSPEKYTCGEPVQGTGIKFLMEFIRMMRERDILFDVKSARILKESKENLGLRIEADLKDENSSFQCARVIFSYPMHIDNIRRMEAMPLKQSAREIVLNYREQQLNKLDGNITQISGGCGSIPLIYDTRDRTFKIPEKR